MGIVDAKADWWNVIIELDNGTEIEVDLLDRVLTVKLPISKHKITLSPSYGSDFETIFNAVKELAMAEDYPMLAFLHLMSFTSMDSRYYNFLEKVIEVYREQKKVLADYRQYYRREPQELIRREWDTVSNINRAFNNIIKNGRVKLIVDFLPYLMQLPADWRVKEAINRKISKIISTTL